MENKTNKYAQKINIQDYDDIINMYNDGYSVRKIARKYNVEHGTITKILKKTGNYIKDKQRLSVKIPSCEYLNIIDLYKNGLTQKQLAAKYNVSIPTISRILKYHNVDTNIKTNGHVRKCIFTENDVKEMYGLYINENMSSTKISEIYGVTPSEILKMFKKYNYKTRDFTYASRKYTINENYFDVIDTQEKAYFLGLLWADGCNFTPNNVVIISLQERDKHILDTFNKELQTDKKLAFLPLNSKNKNHQNQYKLTITNEHISKTLESYGMCQNKSLVIKFPNCLPKELYRHFIRGYFDGDGCIPVSNKDHSINMVGTKEMMEYIQEILLENGIETHLRIHDKKIKSNTYLLRTSSHNNSKCFLDYIYNDSSVYLYRKYNLYIQKYCA